MELPPAVNKTIENNVEIHSRPLKPHLPAIGRFARGVVDISADS